MMAHVPVLKMTLGSEDIKSQGWSQDISWRETFHPAVDVKAQDLTLTGGQWKTPFFFHIQEANK